MATETKTTTTSPKRCGNACPFSRPFAVATCNVCKDVDVCGGCHMIHFMMHPEKKQAVDDDNKQKPMFSRLLPDCSKCNQRAAHIFDTDKMMALCPLCCQEVQPRNFMSWFPDLVITRADQWMIFSNAHGLDTTNGSPRSLLPSSPSLSTAAAAAAALAVSPPPPRADEEVEEGDEEQEAEGDEEQEEETTPRPQRHRPPCTFWNVNKCNRGDNCRFPHICKKCQATDHGEDKCPSSSSSLSPQPPVPMTSKTAAGQKTNKTTTRCNDKVFCQKGLTCPRYHTDKEKKAFQKDPDGQGKGAKPHRTDYCGLGNECPNRSTTCRYAHDASEAHCIWCRANGHIGYECPGF